MIVRSCLQSTERFGMPDGSWNRSRPGRLPSERRALRGVALLLVCCVVVVVSSLGLGRYPVTPGRVLSLLMGGGDVHRMGAATRIVLDIRLPRVLAALWVGASLATAGAVFQGMFRNPLVSPGLLGASSGAGFGAALGILLGLGGAERAGLSFFLGLAAVAAAWGLSGRWRRDSVLGLVLSGIMVSSLFQAGISLVKLVADPMDQLPSITYWLMGSLSSVQLSDLTGVLPEVLLGLAPLYALSHRLDLLTLGEDEARSLGVNVKALRALAVACAALVTSASVSVSGLIGWVGLVTPHLARWLVGPSFRLLLPVSALLGGTLLLLADDLCRTLLSSEIPLGILMAFVGAPFFMAVLWKEGPGE